jgi:hypothetical protein
MQRKHAVQHATHCGDFGRLGSAAEADDQVCSTVVVFAQQAAADLMAAHAEALHAEIVDKAVGADRRDRSAELLLGTAARRAVARLGRNRTLVRHPHVTQQHREVVPGKLSKLDL